ncbi:DUF397 domain-containing protein [Nocardia flavorosea]|uniref:DUF397 domain-containing protein n=1 Tax=Nocardia flavorosea TaxID=53429 RepID=A0A846YCN5_9NOCA|nr:DUF397 domain-containing protein [Nocardia flavorosea]NKY55571.1 DUF397 domain-containing protein [Nocardia flavorosea]
MIDLSNARWFKSSWSSGQQNCVEVAFVSDELVGVRDSKNPSGPPLLFGAAEWAGFLTGLASAGFGAAPDTGVV